MFTELQLILVPLCITFLSLIICYIFFRYGKSAIASPSFEDKMELLYTYIAAGLLGKFLFFSLPNATGPNHTITGAFVSAFIMIGFYVMFCIQKYNRVWYDNPYYTGPERGITEIRNIINKETCEIQEYYNAERLNDVETGQERLTLVDEKAEIRKRRLYFYLTIFILMLTLMFEGFFFVFREPFGIGGSWPVCIFFVIDKLKETAIISIIAVHAYIHTSKQWYVFCMTCWITAVLCSCIPMMVQMAWEKSFIVTTHLATQIFYSLSGGILFWIALYFVFIDRQKTDKCETSTRLIVFGGSAAISWLCGVFV